MGGSKGSTIVQSPSDTSGAAMPHASMRGTIAGTFIDHSEGFATAFKVKKETYDTEWGYRCSTGSNNWILGTTQSNHVIYVVWGAPQCAPALYTKANLDTCTGWANDCTKVDTSDDATNIPHQVQHGAKTWHGLYKWASTEQLPDDPFAWIPTNKGDCMTYADLMTKACQLLGLTASTKKIECRESYPTGTMHWYFSPGRTPHWLTAGGDADGDGTANEDETNYPGTIDTVYVKGSDPDQNAKWREDNAPWNWHGASECAGHWWEITFNSDPDHDTAANMRDWPEGPVIDYPGPLYSGGAL
ncbi:MAG: hypothetical protein NTZ98_24575 [Acidobacteria bacterium]|nr:hypothetical protein [Acidobacteriota bacterium]